MNSKLLEIALALIIVALVGAILWAAVVLLLAIPIFFGWNLAAGLWGLGELPTYWHAVSIASALTLVLWLLRCAFGGGNKS